jgi:hypothetical protein
LSLAALFLAVGACSSRIPTYPTYGKVVYKDDGKPVPGGVVIWFESTTPPYHRASSAVDSQGKFSLGFIHDGDGTMEGEHRISFAPSPPVTDPTPADALARRMPPRYLEFRTSGLKEMIKRGTNELVIKVDRPGK